MEDYNSYMNNYMKKRYADRRSQAIEQLGGVCVSCGITDSLEFDHIEPHTKEVTIARASSYSEERWQKELSKCQLLCSACHREKHRSDIACGTPQKYWRGCRCGECRSAYRSYNQNYRQRRREPL